MDSTLTEVRYLSPREVHERYGPAEQTLANWRSTWPDGDCKGPVWAKIAGALGSPGGRVGYPEDSTEAYFAKRIVRPAA